MFQPQQTKPIISGFTGQEQLPVVKENRGLSSFFFFSFSPLNTFMGSQALSSHNLFLFYCFDVILCFPRQGLVHLGGEMEEWMCHIWHWSKITLFPPSRHTLNKWEIREAERQMSVSVCVCVHFHMGLKRQKGQLVHSSLLCCVLGFENPQGQIVSAGDLPCTVQ